MRAACNSLCHIRECEFKCGWRCKLLPRADAADGWVRKLKAVQLVDARRHFVTAIVGSVVYALIVWLCVRHIDWVSKPYLYPNWQKRWFLTETVLLGFSIPPFMVFWVFMFQSFEMPLKLYARYFGVHNTLSLTRGAFLFYCLANVMYGVLAVVLLFFPFAR
jgi:hypothetical protein